MIRLAKPRDAPPKRDLREFGEAPELLLPVEVFSTDSLIEGELFMLSPVAPPVPSAA